MKFTAVNSTRAAVHHDHFIQSQIKINSKTISTKLKLVKISNSVLSTTTSHYHDFSTTYHATPSISTTKPMNNHTTLNQRIFIRKTNSCPLVIRKDLSSCLNDVSSWFCRIVIGSRFHNFGPTCENARSP